jgi:hypothetical protein
MTTTRTINPSVIRVLAPRHRELSYWLLILPFLSVFLVSVMLNVFDYAGGIKDYEALGFPGWLVWWATGAKLIGLAAVVWGRSRVISTWAYAGFVYDLLLAITAHIAEDEPPVRLVVAIVSLMLTGLAIWADWRSRLPRDPAARVGRRQPSVRD